MRVPGRTAPIVSRIIAVCHPLPHVTRHVIAPIRAPASLVAPHGRRRAIAVIDSFILPLERAVAVAEIDPVAVGLVAPGI